MPSFTANAREEYRIHKNGYTEIRLLIETEEDCFMPCLLLLPDGAVRPPVVICLQGHSKGMLLSVAKPYRIKDVKKIADDRDFAFQALSYGFAALVLEQRGFGERRSKWGENNTMCDTFSAQALLVGRTTVGERVWDVSKAIDILEKREDVDGTKIGVMGNSGGGTATYYAACMDERISIAMPSCSVCSYGKSLIHHRHCTCNYLPGVAKYFDMGDLASLLVPRCIVLVAGKEDKIFLEEGVRETYETIRKIYSDRGVEENTALFFGEGGHRFYRQGWKYFCEFAKRLGW